MSPFTRVAEEVVVAGALVVRVHAHALETRCGALPVWTFVSDGLLAAGQKELVFTVKREPGEMEDDYPRDLLAFYRTVFALARAGRFVGVGGLSETRSTEPGFLGRDDFHCVLYAPYQPLQGVPVPRPSLTALITTCSEGHAREFGLTRVMARLGAAEQFYPTTPWADRKRAEVIGPHGNAGTFLADVPRASLPDAWVRRERSGRVVLTVDTGARDSVSAMLKRLGGGAAVALLVTVDPNADGCLVWEPGQREPAAITPPGSTADRIAGNFAAFVVGAGPEAVRTIEDGYAFVLRASTWKKVSTALAAGVPLSLPSTGEGLEIAWAPDAPVPLPH